MRQLIRRVLLTWIVLTVMLLVLWVKAHAQSPYLNNDLIYRGTGRARILRNYDSTRPPNVLLVQSPYLESHHKIVNHRLPPPSLVKVEDEVYVIVVVPKFADKSLLGQTSNDKKKIWILAGQELEVEKEDVWHELKHAALKTEHSDDIQTMHDFIYDSAGPEVDMLHDNPALVRYLAQ